MIIKTFDCVNLKNEIQEKLFNNLNSKDAKDYFEKLKKSINESIWIKDIIKKSGTN